MKKSVRKPLDLILFFVLGIGVGIAFGMSSTLLLRYNRKEIKKEYSYETVELIDCEKTPILYYREKDRNIYLYCLNSIKVKDGNNSLELKNYYKKNSEVINQMIENLEFIDSLDDGGSSLYRDENKVSENGFTIVRCNNLLGNRDIYIGPKNMNFEKEFCENKN